jgi:hypothetical protein
VSATAIRGVVPIIPVPFGEDESIDRERLAALCDFAVGQRVSALCLPAYGSEFYNPWIGYSLQSMESYNYLEKDPLTRRGLLRTSHPRHPRMRLDADTAVYARFLMDRVLDAVARLDHPTGRDSP